MDLAMGRIDMSVKPTDRCRTFFSSDGLLQEIYPSSGAVTIRQITVNEEHSNQRTVPVHESRTLLMDWLEDRGPGWTGSTIYSAVWAIEYFVQFLNEIQAKKITAEIFPRFLSWLLSARTMKGGDMHEPNRRSIVGFIVSVYRWLADETDGVPRRDLDAVEARYSSVPVFL